MVSVEPFVYQKMTAFRERIQMVDKINEIVDVLNETAGSIEPESSYNIVSTTILYPVGTGLRITGSGHGIISGVAGMSVNGVTRHVPITYYASPLMPDSIICDVILNGTDLQFIKATISGTVETHTINFTLVENGTETPLTVTTARMSMLRRD